jgi:hypothetical protein
MLIPHLKCNYRLPYELRKNIFSYSYDYDIKISGVNPLQLLNNGNQIAFFCFIFLVSV